MSDEFKKALLAAWGREERTLLERGRIDDAYEWGFHSGWMASQSTVAEYREALDYLLEQTVDQDLKYGITLSEGEEHARAKALAVIAKASGAAACK